LWILVPGSGPTETRRLHGAPFLTRAVSIDYPPFGEVVWREFNVYSIAGKYSDSVATHAAGDVGKDRVAIF
jgi:hypothetical protein